MNLTVQSPPSFLDRCVPVIHSLLRNWSKVYKATRPNPIVEDVTPGFKEAKSRINAFIIRGEPHSVVSVLYGPTGAGKSTMFRELTGLDVPIDIRRPWTFGCLVAVPNRHSDTGWLQGVFPDFDLVALSSPDQLRDRSAPTNRLYHATSELIPDYDNVAPLLLDLPDFNSIDSENRVRAEKMLERAEQVVFLSTAGSYKNNDDVRELARACRLSGSLIYVLTKTPRKEHLQDVFADDREVAAALWQDLLNALSQKADFQVRRSDGRTLHDFLSQAAAYFVPLRSEQDAPFTIDRLNGSGSSFREIVFGPESELVVASSLMEPADKLVDACHNEARTIADHKAEVIDRFREIDTSIDKAADHAAQQFPLDAFLAIVDEEAKSRRSRVERLTGWAVGVIRHGISHLTDLKKWIGSGQAQDVKRREDIERESIRDESQKMVDEWRDRFAGDPSWKDALSERRVSESLKWLNDRRIPEPSKGWESEVKKAVKKWADENSGSIFWMNLTADLGFITGGALIVADICITGGIVSTIGGFALGGVASVGGAAFLNWLKSKHLETVAFTTQDAWKKQRQGELKEFLLENLKRPLFAALIEELNKLKTAPIQACLEACAQIKQLAQELKSNYDRNRSIDGTAD